MNFFLLLVLLLLFACSTTSLRDMEDGLVVCLEGGYLCSELQSEIEVLENKKLARERRKALTQCPDGYVFWCSGSWCRRRHTTRMPSRIEMMGSYCVREDEVRRAMRW